mgnify:CR=1 FL=1
MSELPKVESDNLITCDHGRLRMYYNPERRHFLINSVVVEPKFRREGRATALLEYSIEYAKELGARTIGAVIVTREILDGMSKVFGEEAITIEQLGIYEHQKPHFLSAEPEHSTLARLDYSLE